jgi:hypothetical protein
MEEITYTVSTKFLCGPRRFIGLLAELLIPVGPIFQLQYVLSKFLKAYSRAAEKQ